MEMDPVIEIRESFNGAGNGTTVDSYNLDYHAIAVTQRSLEHIAHDLIRLETHRRRPIRANDKLRDDRDGNRELASSSPIEAEEVDEFVRALSRWWR
jgi:hypothetical protein